MATPYRENMLPPRNQEAESTFIQGHSNSDEDTLFEVINLAINAHRPKLAAQLIAHLPADSPAREHPGFKKVVKVLGWLIQNQMPDTDLDRGQTPVSWETVSREWELCSAAFTRARLDNMRHRYREHYREQSKQRRPRGPRNR